MEHFWYAFWRTLYILVSISVFGIAIKYFIMYFNIEFTLSICLFLLALHTVEDIVKTIYELTEYFN